MRGETEACPAGVLTVLGLAVAALFGVGKRDNSAIAQD